MDEVILSPEDVTAVDAFRLEYGIEPEDVVLEGSTIAVGDSLRLYDAFDVHVVGGVDGYVMSYAWGVVIPFFLTELDITDRAPGGMPVFPEEELQARAAKAAASKNPKLAEKRAERAQRRDLREFIDHQPHKTAKLLKKKLRELGVLGHADKDD